MRRGLIIVIAVCVLVLAAGGAFLLMENASGDRETSSTQTGAPGQEGTGGDEGAGGGEDGEPLSDEEFAAAMDQFDDVTPPNVEKDAEVNGVLQLLQGWWYVADGSSNVICVLSGNHYSELGGNGNGSEGVEVDIQQTDISRDGDAWVIDLGEESLRLNDHALTSPELTTPDGTFTLTKGAGDLY